MSNPDTRPPANSATRTIWTQSDESRLQELIARKESVEREGHNALREAFAGLGDSVGIDTEGFAELVQYAARNATAIRDALTYFDNRSNK